MWQAFLITLREGLEALRVCMEFRNEGWPRLFLSDHLHPQKIGLRESWEERIAVEDGLGPLQQLIDAPGLPGGGRE